MKMASYPSADSTQRNQPSRVLYFANLPPGTTLGDVTQACSFSGPTRGGDVFPRGTEALVEMDTLPAAQGIIAFAQVNALRVNGAPVKVAFSNKTGIEKRPPPNGQTQGSTSSLASQGQGQGQGHAYAPMAPPSAGPSNAPALTGKCLLLTITLPFHPIDVNVISAILKPYGDLVRVVIFEKAGAVQALAELRSVEEANAARAKLDGQQIYDGCCNLRITGARQDTIVVKENSERSRDFTNNSLPTRSVVPPGGPQYQTAAAVPAARRAGDVPPGVAPVRAPPPPSMGVQGMYGAPPGYGAGMSMGPSVGDRERERDAYERERGRDGPRDRDNQREGPPHVTGARAGAGGYVGGAQPGGGYYGDRPVPDMGRGGLGPSARAVYDAPPMRRGYGDDEREREPYGGRPGHGDARGPPPPSSLQQGGAPYERRGPAPAPAAPYPSIPPGHMHGPGAYDPRERKGQGQGRPGESWDPRDRGERYPPPGRDDRDRAGPEYYDRPGDRRTGGPPPGPSSTLGSVLMVYNLPRAKVGADGIFNLLCIYGNVVRIKLMNKPENAAMVQMESGTQANAAIEGMNRAPAFGVTMALSTSRQTEVPRRTTGDATGDEKDKEAGIVVKEYVDSPFNRFKAGGPTKPPYKPNNVLYFAGGNDEEGIRATLTAAGAAAPRSVVFLPQNAANSTKEGAGGVGGRRSGFLEYDKIEDAMEVLAQANNSRLLNSASSASTGFSSILKLSFSGKTGGGPARDRDGVPAASSSASSSSIAAGGEGRVRSRDLPGTGRDRSRSRDRNARVVGGAGAEGEGVAAPKKEAASRVPGDSTGAELQAATSDQAGPEDATMATDQSKQAPTVNGTSESDPSISA